MVADFGLAKQLDGEGWATRSRAILGTPSYMAPEQARGRPGEVGKAADVYALGAILSEMLTGRPPPVAEGLADFVQRATSEEPEPVRRLRPEVPRDLETICHRCLRKQPEKRYESAAALAQELGDFLRGVPMRDATRNVTPV